MSADLYEVLLSALPPFELAGSTASSVTLEQRPSASPDDPPPFVYQLDVVSSSIIRVRLGVKGADGVLGNNLKAELPSAPFERLEVRALSAPDRPGSQLSQAVG